MKKLDKFKILLILFFILFGLSIILDSLIFVDFFNPCRIDMNSCGSNLLFNLVHHKAFLKIILFENILNIIISGFTIYASVLKKKMAFIICGVFSILSCFSLWLLLMGEFKIIFS